MGARVAVTFRLLAIFLPVVCLWLDTPAAVQQCLNAQQAASGLTCGFHWNFCQWNATNSWNTFPPLFGLFAVAYLDGAGSSAVLESPPLCATDNGSLLRLEFLYFTGFRPGVCQLTVSVETAAGVTVLATMDKYAGVVGSLNIFCPDSCFKIIIEAKKLYNLCGVIVGGVRLEDINVKFVQEKVQHLFTCTSPNTTRHPPTSLSPSLSTHESEPHPTTPTTNVPEDAEDGTDPLTENGVVVGVVVAVVVVVAVLVVLAVWWRRKRTDPDKPLADDVCRNTPAHIDSLSMGTTNSAYEPDNLVEPAIPCAGNDAVLSMDLSGSTTDTDSPATLNCYSIPSDTPDVSTTHTPRQDENGYELVTISKDLTNQSGEPEAREDKRGNADSYNELSFVPGRTPVNGATKPSHYDHLHDTEEGSLSYNRLAFGADASVNPSARHADYDHLNE